jgi:hypothetical protein
MNAALAVSVLGCAGRSEPGRSADETGNISFAEGAIARLENQSSFLYRQSFRRKGGPMDVQGSFEGKYVFPDRKSVKGRLVMGKREETLDFVAAGDSEYHLDKETGDWLEKPASQEACPLRQLRRTMGLGGYQYIGVERVRGSSASVFSFSPNLAFLDPMMEKELTGRIWIIEKTGLPAKVEAGSKDGSISWEMTLFKFNAPVSVEVPITKVYEADFTLAARGRQGMSETAGLLFERLTLVDVHNVRLESKSAGTLKFRFESESGREDMLDLVSRPGSLQVRIAQWPEGPVGQLTDEKVEELYGPGAVLTHEVRELANALVLTESILSSSDIVDVRLEYDEFSRPIIEFEYDAETARAVEDMTGKHVGKPIGFVLDGEVLDAPVVRKALGGNRMRIGGFTSVRDAKAVSIMLKTKPLPLSARLASVREASR